MCVKARKRIVAGLARKADLRWFIAACTKYCAPAFCGVCGEEEPSLKVPSEVIPGDSDNVRIPCPCK